MRLARVSIVLFSLACSREVQISSGLVVDPIDILPCGFTPLSGTRMSVYDCNPVFTALDEPWSANVRAMAFRTQAVLGHPLFQVWYTSQLYGYETGWGLGHAVSSDGIEWTPHPDNPLYGPTTGWDRQRATALTIAYDEANDEYALAYQGGDLPNNSLGFGVLRSPNGIRWREPDAGSMLYDLTTSSTPICWPLGLSWSEAAGYYGFMAANATANTCDTFRFDAPELSPDAVDLDRFPSLKAGPKEYDASGMGSVAAVELDGVYYMFYAGFRTWVQVEDTNFRRATDTSLALATSTDGVNWSKARDENPFPIALTEPGELNGVGAQAIGERIHIWVTDTYPELDQKGLGYFLYEPYIEAHP